MVVRPDLESCIKSTVRSDVAGAMALGEVSELVQKALNVTANLTTPNGLTLKVAYINYNNILTFKGFNDGNMQGIIIGGAGGGTNYLVGFSYRPADENISFTDSNFTGTCDTDGNITINCPTRLGWTVIYMG